MKLIYILAFIVLMSACERKNKQLESAIEHITSPGRQDSLFNSLVTVTNNGVPANKLKDSLSFLILPIYASCPACRKKTIDSIIKHQDDLMNGRLIIISVKGGRKTISGFFREEGSEIPEINNRLFLDSTNQAFQYDLYDKNPVIYYCYNQKVYKKIIAIPATVKEDLREFFSGHRKKMKNKSV
jgi:hypothetical protein